MFTSPYVAFSVAGGLIILLITVLVFLIVVVSLLILIGGGCFYFFQSRNIHNKTFVGNRKNTMITNLPLSYGDPSKIAPMVRLQGAGPSTRPIQDLDSDDSSSTSSNRILNGQGQRLLLAPPGSSRLGSSRRHRARISQRSSEYSLRSDGRNRTSPLEFLSGEDSGTERRNRHRRRQSRSPQHSDEYSPASDGRHRTRSPVSLSWEGSDSERRDISRRRQARSSRHPDGYAPRSNRRHGSRSPALLSRDRSRPDESIRDDGSDNARSKSQNLGLPWDPGSPREKFYRRGSRSEQWGSLSSDGRPGLADEATV